MKIVAVIKQVPASESKIIVKGDSIEYGNVSYVVNPYDEFAVEEGLRIKEREGAGEVTVLSMGPARVVDSLRTSLAMGADNAVHVNVESTGFEDSFAVATVLAEALKRQEADIILFGKQAIDDDTGAVGVQVAEILNLPHVAAINKLETSDGKGVANRQIEGGTEVVEVSLPAIFTCQKELNEPRYASLPGIMKAKSKPLVTETLESLGLDAALLDSGNKVVRFISPPARTAGRIIEGEAEEAVKELVRLLREEAGAI